MDFFFLLFLNGSKIFIGPIQILFLCSLVAHVHIFVFDCIDFLPLKALKESLSLRSFISIFSETKRINFNSDVDI